MEVTACAATQRCHKGESRGTRTSLAVSKPPKYRPRWTTIPWSDAGNPM
uniref:ADP,ATP carrier protein, putative n=1 Tax=Arundo donax TaxID=35708 RepID=A0A0A9HQ72_ARUDO